MADGAGREMSDWAGLVETFESRRRQLRMRLILAALVPACYGHLVGWTFSFAWAAVYVALQALELRFRIHPGEPLSRRKVRTALAILVANGVVFGSYAVVSPLTYGEWGVANGAFILAGAVVNVTVSNRNRQSFLYSLSPYVLYFPGLALAAVHAGASWQITASLVLAGPMVLVPLLMMWSEAARLRAAGELDQRARIEAEAANSAKDRFLAMMSHEIRTPLNGVLGMTYALDRDELTPVQRERVRVIREAGQNLFTILGDILDVSKIGAGKLTLESIEFDLEAEVRGACAPFLETAEQKGLTFEVHVAEEATGRFLGDPTRVRQILYNLASNAVKFTSAGSVDVRVTRPDEQLCLQVRDSGLGLSPEQLERLFEPFSQADVSTTRKFGGTGLGLSIIHQLVLAMGGRIEVGSRLGEGTTFQVHLPLERVGDAGAPVAEAPKPEPEGGADLRILAAEDNPTNQLVLRTLLEQAGVGVTIVGDGAAAVEAWEAASWDLILMDVRMPVMDGPTATIEIRRREAETGRRRTPIVALTANVMPHQVEEYRRAGMDDLVGKPIEIGKLFATMEAALDAAAGPSSAAAA